MLINIKSFELGEKSGKKEALEDELKFLEDLDYLMPSSKEEIRCMRIKEIKQKLEKLK